ncbi:hypothetical protein Hanom_Chr12g01156581 [Helianthus anomalus]
MRVFCLNVVFKVFKLVLCFIFQTSNVLFDPLHNICSVYDKEIPKMAEFTGILEFMERLSI